MKTKTLSMQLRWGLLLAGILTGSALAQNNNTLTDGPWSQQQVVLLNTPEAELMARTGDIDNLGFGWPAGFNPFSGKNTPVHSYPWAVDPVDAAGTDRIMVVSSYNGHPPHGSDGYTQRTDRPANLPQPITVSYNLSNIVVTSAVLQMFVDDFQASVWRASYQVTINGVRAPFMETVINALVQTGPIGKLITLQVPDEFLPAVRTGQLQFLFDDPTTGAGDGYAIDFIKLLVNPGVLSQTATITGHVRDQQSGLGLAGAVVTAGGAGKAITDSTGAYTLTNVPAGLVAVLATRLGYQNLSTNVSTTNGQTLTLNLNLVSGPPVITFLTPSNGYTSWACAPFTVVAQASNSLPSLTNLVLLANGTNQLRQVSGNPRYALTNGVIYKTDALGPCSFTAIVQDYYGAVSVSTNLLANVVLPPLHVLVADAFITNGQCLLCMSGQVGRAYNILATTNFQTWTNLGPMQNVNGLLEFPDPAATNFPYRFYRAVSSTELTEGNASDWGTFASDGANTSTSDDATHVKVGLRSLRFDTASGFDTGVTYPRNANAGWDLSALTHLTFWTYADNTNFAFQGYQPIIVLNGPGGSFTYTPQQDVMPNHAWSFQQIPLAGSALWQRTVSGSPSLSNINQLEIHQDTWDVGFTMYYDGVGFTTLSLPAAAP